MTVGTDMSEEARLRPIDKQRRFGTFRAVMALIMREVATTYGRSPGGYIWAILEPIAAIAMLSLAFSLMVRHPPLGTTFVMFYATGMLPLQTFTNLSGRVQSSINYSRPLLVYPSVTFADAIAARFILALMTKVLVSIIIFSAIRAFYDTRTVVDFPAVTVGFAMCAALGLGIGSLNCVLVSLVPIWERMWGILTVPLMLMSCIFYTYDSLPAGVRAVLWYNPLVHVVGQVRAGFYPFYAADYVSHAYVFTIALVPMLIGLVFLRRWHRIILNR